MFVLIRQNLHGTVTDIDQVDQRFNSLAALHHITAQRPESFLLIVTLFINNRYQVLFCIPGIIKCSQ